MHPCDIASDTSEVANGVYCSGLIWRNANNLKRPSVTEISSKLSEVCHVQVFVSIFPKVDLLYLCNDKYALLFSSTAQLKCFDVKLGQQNRFTHNQALVN